MRLADAPAPQCLGEDAPTQVLPRWIGDELVVTGATNKVYKAFGGCTDGWVQVWP